MGQRHQIFVLARVRSKGEATGHRRCVAAYHHQWCYGRIALQCLSRFLRLASQPENFAMIRRDIANVQGDWGEVPAEDIRGIYVPCPFIAYLLQLAWNVNLDDVPVYVAGVSFSNAVLDARMQSSGGDNNDGITVIDVTGPNVSYCFNNICGPPLTAERYVRKYYRPIVNLAVINDDELQDNKHLRDQVIAERSVVRAISALEGVPLMSIDALVEAWPWDYTRTRDDMITAGTHTPDNLSSEEPQPEMSTTSVPPLPVQPAIHSLADISLHQAVIHAVNAGDIDRIQDTLSVSGQSEIVLRILCDMSPLPPVGVELLGLVIGLEQPADTLNLSDIDLSSSAILGLTNASSSTLNKLDLTGNQRVTVHDLVDILRTAPSMRQLVIFDCPLISDEDVYGLLASSPKSVYALDYIGHSAFFKRARDRTRSCPYVPAFTCIVQEGRRPPLITALPYFTPSRLLRSLYTLLKPVAVMNEAEATVKLLEKSGQKPDITLLGMVVTGYEMFSSTAILHAAFTTWYADAASVTDAIRVAQGQEPDPSGLRANTQRITLIPQMSTSFDGWLLLIQLSSFGTGSHFAFARKRQNGLSASAPAVEDSESAHDAAPDLELFSFVEFIEALKEEGRPAPPAADVAALANIIETAYPGHDGDKRFETAGAAKFLADVTLGSRRMLYR
ncbi:hypothetical protein PENSPDRAFT_611006 [Peniophora sp. CONT]|nr:hypothetical protein PENSPDRAFT_611006 [Peniophora sp. CONT]